MSAPFVSPEGVVLPEWIDHNGHLNLAYYLVLFDHGTDALFNHLGLGEAYRAASGHGTFAVESHILYRRELLVGERVRISTTILGADAKRLHLAHEMLRADDGTMAAMQEVMFVHVDLAIRRVVTFGPALRARLHAEATNHAALPRPEWVGRRLETLAG